MEGMVKRIRTTIATIESNARRYSWIRFTVLCFEIPTIITLDPFKYKRPIIIDRVCRLFDRTTDTVIRERNGRAKKTLGRRTADAIR